MGNLSDSLIIIIAVYIGQFFVQYWLSTRPDRWVGWVLPILNLGGGIVFAISATNLLSAVTAFLMGGGVSTAILCLLYYVGRRQAEAKKSQGKRK